MGYKLRQLLLAALLCLAPFAAEPTAPKGQAGVVTSTYDPLPGTTFNNAVANTGIPLVADYVFGSSATAGAGQTAITNATQLAAYFNSHLDATGTNKVNSELEAYTESFSGSSNHVFNTNNLQLTGTLAGGGAVAPTVSGSLGANPGITTTSFTTGN